MAKAKTPAAEGGATKQTVVTPAKAAKPVPAKAAKASKNKAAAKPAKPAMRQPGMDDAAFAESASAPAGAGQSEYVSDATRAENSRRHIQQHGTPPVDHQSDAVRAELARRYDTETGADAVQNRYGLSEPATQVVVTPAKQAPVTQPKAAPAAAATTKTPAGTPSLAKATGKKGKAGQKGK